jgi:site-specific DNA recombinase
LTTTLAPPAKAKPKRRPTGTTLGPPTGPRRVAIYLRRSTDDEHQPFSVQAQ